MALFISEVFVNATEGYRFGESEPQEAFTSDKGKLFKFLLREYGRCVSKMYVDTANDTKQVGWVFQKRMKYGDAIDNKPESYYIREVWVRLHDAPPTVTVKHHYTEFR